MKKILAGGMLFVAVLGVGGTYAYSHYFAPKQAACTLDAKICPDGSTVGRVGPSCEFAACPAPQTPPPGKITQTVAIGESASGYGMTVTPASVSEDSRCPVGARCVQAGTVRVNLHLVTRLGDSDTAFALGDSVPLEQGVITLTNVDPPKATGTAIASSSYRFTFEFDERATPVK